MPTAENPLARRIKKHITSREHEFFVITGPRLETVCQKELCTILPQNETFVQPGGVTFFGRPESMYAANLHLRSATRVLMRIGGFKATGFSEFTKKMARLPFDLFFTGDVLPDINISTHHCRLYHSNALKEAAAAFLKAVFTGATESQTAPRLYIRGLDDHFTVSLDTSGPSLYKRGFKNHGGKAPLRETLAYAILQYAGYNGGPLMDPMCGSGTFSLEAALSAIGAAPGLMRDFAFMQAPFFNQKQWEFLQKTARAKLKTPGPKPVIIATDKDAEACAKLQETVKTVGLEAWVKVVAQDFFSLSAKPYFKVRKGLVVLNPPYGLRLLERAEAENLYGAICQKLTADFEGWRYALVTPNMEWVSLKNPAWHKIWHGGLELFLATGQIA